MKEEVFSLLLLDETSRMLYSYASTFVFLTLWSYVCPSESCPLSNTTFPHILPFLALMEKSEVGNEGKELWDMAEVGVDMVMNHLGAARTIAQLGAIYKSNAKTKLQGKRV